MKRFTDEPVPHTVVKVYYVATFLGLNVPDPVGGITDEDGRVVLKMADFVPCVLTTCDTNFYLMKRHIRRGVALHALPFREGVTPVMVTLRPQ